nr:MFS transporter [Bacilli bacterium]
MPGAHDSGNQTSSKVWILITVMMAMMLAALDMTIVGTAMPSIINDLHGLANYSWVFSAYLLTSTVPVPIFSKLADMYGRKKLFLLGAGIFTLGSLLCGLSNSMLALIFFRAIQGLGAAGVLPIALTIIGDVFTLEQRAKVQGFFSAVWGVSAVVGPLLGALIVQYSNWRIVFYLNVPIGIIVMIILFFSFKEKIQSTKHQIDFLGTLLLTVSVTSLLLVLVEDANQLLSTPALTLFAVSLVSLIGFIVWERRAKEPVLPGILFSNRMLLVANGSNLFAGAVMFGLISYLPLYIQGVLGGSPTLAGRAITPMLIGWPLAALVAGPIILRIGFRLITIVGGLLIALGSLVLAIALQGDTWTMNVALLFIGIGLGFSLTSLLIAAQNAVPWQVRGAVTGSSQFFRTIGGSVGVAIMGTILNDELTMQSIHRHVAENPSNITGVLLSTTTRSHLSHQLLSSFTSILNVALHEVFVTGFLFAVGVALLVAFLPNEKSRKQVKHSTNSLTTLGEM